MENSDIASEKVEKLYDYLKGEKNRKIKNIESKISAKEELLTELDDEKVENINQEIEGLKKYKEQIEEELNNVEELKEFSSNLKEIEEEIEQVENEIKEVENEEKNIDLNDEDAPSNLYDLSERKKELEIKKGGLNWERKSKVGIILVDYGKELDEMPENMRYSGTISSLKSSLENSKDIKDITLQKMDFLKERIAKKGIELPENGVYDLSSLKGNDRKLAESYNDLVNKVNEFDLDATYYESQIDSLTKLADVEKQIDDLKNDEENNQKIEELNNSRKELIEKVKDAQKKYNNKSELQEKQEEREEPKEQEIKTDKKEHVKNKKTVNYHSASYSLNKKYEAKLQELSQNKYDLESQLDDIVQEFKLSDVDIEDEFSYQDNDELVKLKAEYDILSEEKEEVELSISDMENSDILDKIEEIKQVENQIEEIDSELEKIDNELEEYNEIIENDELSDDSEEKKNAKIKLEKLKKEKSEKITDKNENIGKKDELYKYVNDKISGKSKNKEKSKNSKNINQNEGYWVFPNETNTQQSDNENSPTNDNIVVNEENAALSVLSGNIIDEYSKADNTIRNSLYLSKVFTKLVDDLKLARGINNISRNQKKFLKKAIEEHGELISQELKGLNQKEFTKIVTSIYGNDNSFLSKYMKKDATTGEDIIRLGLFYDLYEHNENNITKIKTFDKMNSQSIEFIDDLFNKYYEKVKNGEIEKDSDLDIQFKKMIANPVKFAIISGYNKDIQKPFLFRLNKIKSLFSKKSKQSQDILEKVSSNIKSNEISLIKTNGKVDKLGLGDSVVKNPPPIVNPKETPTRSVDAKQL